MSLNMDMYIIMPAVMANIILNMVLFMYGDRKSFANTAPSGSDIPDINVAFKAIFLLPVA